MAVSILLDGGISIGKCYEAFANATLMFGFYTQSGMSVIGVGWTLGVIFGFYILFPFFVYLIWTKRRAWLMLIITVIISHVSSVYFVNGRSLCFPWLCYFMAGGLIYLYKSEIEKCLSNTLVGLVITVLGFILVFVVETPFKGAVSSLFLIIKTLVGFSLMIIGTLGKDTKIWNNRISKVISNVSLEIYLAHMMVFRVIEKIGFTRLVGTTLCSYIITCVLVVVLVLLFAVIYKLIEFKLKLKWRSSCDLRKIKYRRI